MLKYIYASFTVHIDTTGPGFQIHVRDLLLYADLLDPVGTSSFQGKDVKDQDSIIDLSVVHFHPEGHASYAPAAACLFRTLLYFWCKSRKHTDRTV